jgi:hypothetical protein
MLRIELLRDHVEALRRLAGVSREPAVAARLQELADELRIMVSVAEVSDLAAGAPPPLRPSAAAPLRAISSDRGAAKRAAMPRRRAGNER